MDFEELYIEVRRREKRIYEDDMVLRLPDVSNDHRYYHEWMARKKSLDRLIQYLKLKHKRLSILDVGCGNGWMSNQLAKLPMTEVVGIDVNHIEIEQASRVFSGQHNLKFIQGEITSDLLNHYNFGIIVFASSIQYFKSLANVLHYADKILVPRGEIHIIDSPFYTDKEVHDAKEASNNHFNRLGFPEMSNYYHHHIYRELNNYRPKYLFAPNKVKSKLLRMLKMRNDSPFPWIRIKKYGKGLLSI
jgi:ubiquinone/menaquinone biosynthesis C-methylase UbiE